MMLAARALSYGFRDRVVGRGIDFAIASGEVVCLLGPNGSGKSTLARTLLGLLAPLAGDVLLDNQPLATWPARARATRLAYVPQAASTDFDFTLQEMVEMGRAAHRGAFAHPGAPDRAAAAAALERLGIAHLAGRPFHRVSGGERQLALIARALATEAACVVMDEPTANLDFGNQSLILDEIARLGASGKSVLFSTHHPEHALRVGGRALLLKEGSVTASGAMESVVTSAALTALYGRPIEVLALPTPAGERRICVSA
jgi:iron complex transport system ATP-binding protein